MIAALTFCVFFVACGSSYDGTYVYRNSDSDDGATAYLTLSGDTWSVREEKGSDLFEYVTSGKFEVKNETISLKWLSPLGVYVTWYSGTIKDGVISITFEVQEDTSGFTVNFIKE